MGDVVSFKGKKNEATARNAKQRKKPASAKLKAKKVAENSPVALKSTAKTKKKNETLNAESIKLWWISQEFDELIRKAVIDKHIPVEELSAVMAHRLGSLLVVSDRTPELTLFCLKIISKITNQKSSGSNAS